VLGAWRGGLAFREPPHDLGDAHRRFIEHVLAANPGAAFRAACGYPIDKKLRSLKSPLTVFAPHDDIIEQTRRVKPLLSNGARLPGSHEIECLAHRHAPSRFKLNFVGWSKRPRKVGRGPD